MRTLRPGRPPFRYLPEEPDDQVWGIFLRDSGAAEIPPGSAYPPPGHPAGYSFDWHGGRVLQEFQILLVRRGRGLLETRSAGRRQVRAGAVIVLFPGEWHRYRPAPATGWAESWVGFSGDYAAHLMRHYFRPAEPVVRPRRPEEVAARFDLLAEIAARRPGRGRSMSLRIAVLELIAMLHAGAGPGAEDASGRQLETARLQILTQAHERIEWPAVARRCGLGYATFRRRFKAMTGRSPLDYQIQVRLNRAAELLRHSSKTAREIAEQLGYAHVHFFSRQFKKRFGQSPQKFRQAETKADGRSAERR